MPTRGIFPGCWAFAPSGQKAAAPRRTTTSRRFICSLPISELQQEENRFCRKTMWRRGKGADRNASILTCAVTDLQIQAALSGTTLVVAKRLKLAAEMMRTDTGPMPIRQGGTSVNRDPVKLGLAVRWPVVGTVRTSGRRR